MRLAKRLKVRGAVSPLLAAARQTGDVTLDFRETPEGLDGARGATVHRGAMVKRYF